MARGRGGSSAPKAPTKVIDKMEPKMDLSKENYSSVAVQAKVQRMEIPKVIEAFLKMQKIGFWFRTREENKLFYWTYTRLYNKGMMKGSDIRSDLKSKYLPKKK